MSQTISSSHIPSIKAKLLSSENQSVDFPAYLLMAESPFFLDMLGGTDLKESPIPMEATSEDLNLLERFMNDKDSNLAEWNQISRLLELSKKYEFYKVEERIINLVSHNIHKYPWNAFCLASHQNDVKLAKDALRVMKNEEFCWQIHVSSITIELASQPTLGHLVGLFQVTTSFGSVNATNHYDNSNWGRIADEFMPRS